MGQQRHGGQYQESHPVEEIKAACSEKCDKIWKFRYHQLQPDSHGKSDQHQAVFQMVHFKKRHFHIPHSDCVEELCHSEHCERISLAV